MGYIAKAYVKKQGSLVKTFIEIVSQRGYRCGNGSIDGNDDLIYIDIGNVVTVSSEVLKHEGFLFDNNTIDCNAYTPNGTEEEAVKLFLELAQMTDDFNSEKWFSRYGLHPAPNRLETYYEKAKNEIELAEKYHTFREVFHELTPLEVAEAFRDGRIEL